MTTPAMNDIRTRAQAALAESPLMVLRELKVETVDGVLMISGSVGSFYHKQVAQEMIRAIAGKVTIRNQIFVQYNDVRLVEEG